MIPAGQGGPGERRPSGGKTGGSKIRKNLHFPTSDMIGLNMVSTHVIPALEEAEAG